VGSDVVGGSLLQLQEEGAETSQQVDLAGDIVNGDDTEGVLFPGGEVAGIQGRKGGRGRGHFLFLIEDWGSGKKGIGNQEIDNQVIRESGLRDK